MDSSVECSSPVKCAVGRASSWVLTVDFVHSLEIHSFVVSVVAIFEERDRTYPVAERLFAGKKLGPML